MPSGRGNPFPASGPFAPVDRGKRAEKATCHFADVDSQGKVTVSFASLEDVRRAPIPRPCVCKGDEKGLFSFWDMMSVFNKYEASFTR